jgi:hypothetical protein
MEVVHGLYLWNPKGLTFNGKRYFKFGYSMNIRRRITDSCYNTALPTNGEFTVFKEISIHSSNQMGRVENYVLSELYKKYDRTSGGKETMYTGEQLVIDIANEVKQLLDDRYHDQFIKIKDKWTRSKIMEENIQYNNREGGKLEYIWKEQYNNREDEKLEKGIWNDQSMQNYNNQMILKGKTRVNWKVRGNIINKSWEEHYQDKSILKWYTKKCYDLNFDNTNIKNFYLWTLWKDG